MDRNVLLAVAAAKEAWDDAGLDGVDPARVGILVGSAIGGIATIVEQQQVFAERGPDRVSPFFIPSVLVDTASGQIAIQLGLKGQNFAPVSACATGSTAIGEAAASIRRGQADVVACRRHRGADHAADPRRLLRDARARRRGGGPDARLAPVRRDAGRVRHGGGGLHPRARGARGRTRPRRDDLRGGARLRRLERRASPRPARAGGDRRRRDDRCGARRRGRRSRAGGLRQRARDVDPARRPRRDARAQAGVRRPRLPSRGLVDEVRDGPLLRVGGRRRGHDVRSRAATTASFRRRSTTGTRTRSATSTTSRTRRAGSRSTSRSRTRWASAATTPASCSAGSTDVASTSSGTRQPADHRHNARGGNGTADGIPRARCGRTRGHGVPSLRRAARADRRRPGQVAALPDRAHDGAARAGRGASTHSTRARVEQCWLVQIPEFVPPEDIFTEYAYFSAYSDSWVEHARRYVGRR